VLREGQDDGEQAPFVGGLRGAGIDALAEEDSALEGSVVDLDVPVAARLALSARAVARNDEDVVHDREVDVTGVDPGQLDDDVQGGRLLRPEDVHPGTKAGPPAPEARLAEVGEELLHLAHELVGILGGTHAIMVAVGRLLKLAGAAIALLLYVWAAGVRAAPGIRARKAARRSLHQ
jgi:hypothetical protein